MVYESVEDTVINFTRMKNEFKLSKYIDRSRSLKKMPISIVKERLTPTVRFLEGTKPAAPHSKIFEF